MVAGRGFAAELYGTAIRVAATTGATCGLLAVLVWLAGRDTIFASFASARRSRSSRRSCPHGSC
jgi:hypothetical protein